MDSSVTFSSPRFRPVLPDECQVNPGRYGAELAFWLCARLAEEGVVTSYPNYEDWGWFIEYLADDGAEFWLCCGNVEGETDRWHCFLDARPRGLLSRSKPPIEKVRPLMDTLARVLEKETSVDEIQWSEESSSG